MYCIDNERTIYWRNSVKKGTWDSFDRFRNNSSNWISFDTECWTLCIFFNYSLYRTYPVSYLPCCGFVYSRITCLLCHKRCVCMEPRPENKIYQDLRSLRHSDGKKSELVKVMQDLNRFDEIDDYVDIKKSERNDINDWKELFTEKCNIQGLFIATGINMLQYGNGSLIVTFFSTSIFEQAGSSIEPNLASIIIGCTQLSGSVIAPFFVEKSGRRPLLMTSTAICCGSMIVFGVYFYLSHIGAEVIQHFKWLPLVALAVFYLSNNMGFGVIPSTLTGEMFKSNVRSKGTALVIVISWIFGFAVTTLFNSTITRFGAHIIFWFFGLICGVAFLFTLFFVPETKGKSLAEITKMLNG
ncbi:facilitated trehalose transporter Tret1-like isoform X3 [Leptidea sinapis]|uniref:facilitated trehalose transporter Tret1-like isoform X3 n=1 Tax=Leptidea sinapis TaxID=189913 RepID=UPI0021C35370|nr:facilitated trehalose transporter Tret1-like isoform X3 [Leptidea sinapis]